MGREWVVGQQEQGGCGTGVGGGAGRRFDSGKCWKRRKSREGGRKGGRMGGGGDEDVLSSSSWREGARL